MPSQAQGYLRVLESIIFTVLGSREESRRALVKWQTQGEHSQASGWWARGRGERDILHGSKPGTIRVVSFTGKRNTGLVCVPGVELNKLCWSVCFLTLFVLRMERWTMLRGIRAPYCCCLHCEMSPVCADVSSSCLLSGVGTLRGLELENLAWEDWCLSRWVAGVCAVVKYGIQETQVFVIPGLLCLWGSGVKPG